MENIPTDYVNGTDFRVTKTTQRTVCRLSHSKWAPKERGLNEEELAAIDSNGLYNLNDFLSKVLAQKNSSNAEMFPSIC